MRPLLLTISLVFAALLTVTEAMGQATTVFKGRPIYGVEEFGYTRKAGEIDSAKASMAEVVISQIGEKYYWASRENRELTKISGGNPPGSLVTYLAIDGSGYVRVAGPVYTQAMKTKIPDYNLDYTEHMTIGLGSFTYFGRSRN